MKIRVISDLHLDVNEKYPFSFKNLNKNQFTLVCGDVAGNVKLVANWIRNNIKYGIFIAGNHDPCYNDSGKTIQEQKQYLHDKFPLDNDVTFFDESVGVMSKEIPNSNILVVGSTLYTDYKHMNEDDIAYIEKTNERMKNDDLNDFKPLTVQGMNMSYAEGGLNDFRWGHVPYEIEPVKQRYVRPSDYLNWFNITFSKIEEIVKGNPTKDIIVITHHCPSIKCVSSNYVSSNMNASYISDLEKFILDNKNIKAWCCGHVHNASVHKIGDANQLIVCNPRGYERHFEADDWNPNTFIDTDTWDVVTDPYEPSKELLKKRKEEHDYFKKWAPFFI